MIKTTKAQRKAIYKLWGRLESRPSYRAFRQTVMGTIGMDGAVIANWSGMFIAIETDGYCHS